MMKSVLGATVIALSISQMALSSEYSKVNGSVSVPAGQTVRSASTVNGSIEVGDKAHLGSAETVNGSVTLGVESTASDVDTVNGAIRLGSGAQVSGNVEAVNGKLSVGSAAFVGGRLANVNGTIVIEKAHIKGKIETVNGDLTVGAGALVDGGIHYTKPKMSWNMGRAPRVVIGPEAIVGGTLIFEREVALYVSDTAKIGPVTGAKVVRFTGTTPPG
jgi:DUF4097 and DUF4098 domain-containing protein YvlB